MNTKWAVAEVKSLRQRIAAAKAANQDLAAALLAAELKKLLGQLPEQLRQRLFPRYRAE